MRISDWSSDVCSSDLYARHRPAYLERDPVAASDASGPLGGVAVLCPWLAIAGDAQSQHVHLFRDYARRRPAYLQRDPVAARAARGPLRRVALLCPWLAMACDAQSQHVNLDRDVHLGRIALQRGRDARSRAVRKRPRMYSIH